MPAARNELLIVALSTAAAGAFIAIGFAHAELASWWHDRPAMLAALVLAALVLSGLGAAVPRYLPIPRMGSVSTLGRFIAGLLLGVSFLLVVGIAERALLEFSAWGLLVYFFFGALLLGTYFVVVPRRI